MEIRKIGHCNQRIVPLMLVLVFMFGMVHTASAQTTDFVGNPTTGEAPLTVVFTDLSTGYYTLVSHQNWTFPGGNPSSKNNVNIGEQVTVVYDTPGTYTVTLTTIENGYPAGQEIKTDYIIVLEPPPQIEYDWGDAPAPYPTIQADYGASHAIDPPDFFLGAGVDGEMDGQAHAEAFGDDSDGWDDDDGVVFTTALQSGSTAGVDVTASMGDGYLNAWIDFNGNGTWADPGEQIFTDQLLAAGVNSLTFLVPPGSPAGYTFARFRFSFTQGLTFTGPADNGEVEDYRVQLMQGPQFDFGDAIDKFEFTFQYPTYLAQDGARHPISGDIYLGNSVDGEPDGQPHWQALGDDNDGNDDEDGVILPLLSPGAKAEVQVKVHGNGYLNAWIDFFGNEWSAGDHVFKNVYLETGVHTLIINDVPFIIGEYPCRTTFARFRFSGDRDVPPFGLGGPGEVEDYIVKIVLDFGDAPDDSYHTLFHNNGACHPISFGPAGIMGMPTLGSSNQFIDGESDGQPSPDARGDDDNGSDDEDGVVIPVLVPGETATLIFTLENTFSAMVDPHPEPYLHGWIDFNYDGDFLDPGEHVFESLQLDEGIYPLDVNVPINAVQGFTYARFRYSFDRTLGPDKMGSLGEVEDYCVLISSKPFDFGDAPDGADDPRYPTLMINEGAVHTIVQGWHLGAGIDQETDGQPDEAASGDDLNENDDEDGVVFHTDPLIAGETAHITVTVACPPNDGFLSAWVDFNGDGDWEDPNEQIFHLERLDAGIHDLAFPVPPEAVNGNVYARFRLYVNFPFDKVKGWGGGGEVEDYRIEIAAPEDPDPNPETNKRKWGQMPLLNRNSDFPDDYSGWDETSIVTHRIAADDWFCGDARPVTKIRWWGSYSGWQESAVPQGSPESFVISIWTNNQTDPAQGSGLPNEVVWQQTVARNQTNETMSGSDYHSTVMTDPETCFEYEYTIPDGAWFYQSGDSAVYWITIAARYPGQVPTQYRWGWLTRRRYFGSSAVSILNPSDPVVGSIYQSGDLIMQGGWDMAFMLFSSQAGGAYYDFGDAPDPEYPTLLNANGAHHMILPGVFLGSGVDDEANGQSDSEALSDDHNGDDDEDNVVFNSDIVPGGTAYINVTASTDGVLNGWMDFNADGDWNDAGEHVLTDQAVLIGLNNIAFDVPGDVTIEKTIARFRFGLRDGLTPYGLDIGGEVEDYEVTFSLPERFWADIDGDGDIDIIDIQLVAAHWNSRVGDPLYDPRYDLDNEGVGDGDIDIIDVQLVAALWNQPIPPAAGLGKAPVSHFSSGPYVTLRWADAGVTPVIEVYAEDAADLAGFEMDLVSKTGVPEIVSVEPGSFFTDTDNKAIILGPQVSDYGNRISMGLLSFGSDLAHQSSGCLAKITLAEIPESLSPENLQMVDTNGHLIEVASLVNALGDRQAIPRKFQLKQSYPNPFNPETTIPFDLPHAGEVRLTVFDINGRDVCTLIQDQWSAGFHRVVWDGRDGQGRRVATGMYFYRIDFQPTEGGKKPYTEVKKMILMK